MEVQRAALVLAQRLVVELARDVARDVAHDEPHDLVVDPARAPVDAPRIARVDLRRRQPARAIGRQVDERPRRFERVEVCAPRSRSNSMNPFPGKPASRSSTSSPHALALV